MLWWKRLNLVYWLGSTLQKPDKSHYTILLIRQLMRVVLTLVVSVCTLSAFILVWDKWREVKYIWWVDTLAYYIPVRQDTCDTCFPNFTFQINPTELCATSSSQVQLVIMICSAANNTAARRAIRTTWASITHSNTARVRHVFLFGTRNDRYSMKYNTILRNESVQYNDIIQANLIDSYYNLTYKTVMGLQWATTYCSNAKFVMKTDDDVFINITRLLERLTDDKAGMSLSGACRPEQGGSKPIRSLNKWQLSVDDYPKKFFPPYCSGIGYILPLYLAEKVVKVSHDITFLKMEDVYVGICVHSLGYMVYDIPGFYAFPQEPSLEMMVNKSRKCIWNNDVITLHHTTPETIQKIWKSCFISPKLSSD